MVSNRHLRIQRNFSVSPVGFKHLSLETMKNKKHRQAINDFYGLLYVFEYVWFEKWTDRNLDYKRILF